MFLKVNKKVHKNLTEGRTKDNKRKCSRLFQKQRRDCFDTSFDHGLDGKSSRGMSTTDRANMVSSFSGTFHRCSVFFSHKFTIKNELLLFSCLDGI